MMVVRMTWWRLPLASGCYEGVGVRGLAVDAARQLTFSQSHRR